MTPDFTFSTLLFLLSMMVAVVGCKPANSTASDDLPATAPAGPEGAASGPVLVELFTSEGCSSCPPADAVLSELARKNKDSGSVLTIAWHVDYWDRLGWRDRFDDPAYSARQVNYSRALKLDSIYTPQIVVNGQQQFVGSDRATLIDAIAAAQRRPRKVGLSLDADLIEPTKVRVHWKAIGETDGATLRLVLIENDLSSAVKRGENSGRVLLHSCVARGGETEAMKKDKTEGTLDVTIPADAKQANLQIVGFVQNEVDMSVLGAARVAKLEKVDKPAHK